MKKLFIIILALLLLCGCAATPPADTTGAETTTGTPTTAENETKPPYDFTITYDDDDELSWTFYTHPVVVPSVIPADVPTNGTELYFVEKTNDIDFYHDSNFSQFDVVFISPEWIDRSEVRINLPVDVSFYTRYDMCLLLQAPDAYTYMPDGEAAVSFTYETYLSYCGFDWAELGKKYQKAQDILTDPQYDEKPVARQEAYLAAYDEYWNSYQALWEEYINLDESRIPKFYPYVVSVMLDTPSVEEEITFNTVDVIIKGETYTVDIGEIRMHPSEAVQTTDGYSDYMETYNAAAFSPITEYNNVNQFNFDFTAKEDLVLTGFDIPYGNVEYGDVNISISGTEKTADFIWDCKSSVEVPQGSHVSIWVTITDERLREHGFSFHFWPCLTFEADGMQFDYGYTIWLSHYIDPYEEYAKYYQDIDTDSYYEDFYFPYILGIDEEE